MNKFKISIFFILLTISILVFLSNWFILFPADVLQNIPSFSDAGWKQPKNSLLADPVYQFEPWRNYAKSEIRQGRFPLWNDNNSYGVPFFANFQSAVLYPLNFIYYILPSNLALNIISFSKLAILFTGMYLYLRKILVGRELAVVISFLLTFSAFPITWLLWPHTNVYILLPLMLYLTEVIRVSKGNRYRYKVVLSLIYMIAIFGGHPETLFHVTLLHTSYSVFRFWNNKKLIFNFFVSVLTGFLLAAIQIIPFIEYLKNSYVLHQRQTLDSNFFLPLKSFTLNIFPFIYGAPQREIYRPITSSTNFQETVGGYVGVVVLAFILFSIFKKRNSFINYWSFVTIFCLGVSYRIWPFYLVSKFPFLELSANQRLTSLAGFSIIIIFSKFLSDFQKNKLSLSSTLSPRILLTTIISVVIFYLFSFFLHTESMQLVKYYNTIRTPLLIIVLSALTSLLALTIKNKKLAALVIGVAAISQSIFFFVDYNPAIQPNQFYPQTDLVKILKKLPEGYYLEVGNPSLPANINLEYSLKNIQNYDAIEIRKFKEEFNSSFTFNSWGNTETVEINTIQKLGIKYLLSDHNINLLPQVIQGDNHIVLSPITNYSPKSIIFTPLHNNLKEIRIKPATFNRTNNCLLKISIINSSTSFFEKSISCRDLRNNMYYVIPVDYKFENKKFYKIIISSTTNSNNSVSLYGDIKGEPYLELLFNNSGKNNFRLIGQTKYISVFKPIKKNDTFNAERYLLFKNPTKSIYDITTSKKLVIVVPREDFPGWKVLINGKETKHQVENSFISVTLNKGKNIVEIVYKPTSFIIGSITSFLTLICLLISLLRKEKNYIIFLERKIAKYIKNLSFTNWVTAIALGLVISTLLFISLVSSIRLANTFTTSINWITVNNYPKNNDYLYFYGYLLTTFLVCMLSIFLIILWKKRR